MKAPAPWWIPIPDVWSHVKFRYPTSTPFKQVAKVAEESGEAIGAAIKADEGRPTKDSVEEELSDVILAAIGALQARGADVNHEVVSRWQSVSQRGAAV